MTQDDRWLAAGWPFVTEQLPPPPASVLEIGCGAVGGFVPALRDAGYRAAGVDPDAPEGPDYRRVEFERYQPPQSVDGVVASLSLHHVADLDLALDRLADTCWRPAGCWWWSSGPGSGSTRPPPAGPSPAWPRPPRGTSPAGCTGTRSGGRPPASPGTTTSGRGPNRKASTRASRSCGGWTRDSTAGSRPSARTSSAACPPPARPRSRRPSTPA